MTSTGLVSVSYTEVSDYYDFYALLNPLCAARLFAARPEERGKRPFLTFLT